MDKDRAVIYVRVSTRKQLEKGVSLEEQEARMRAYCAAFDLEVVAVYRDGAISARLPLHRRPAGARMLKALKAGEAQHLVAKHLDRLFRSTEEALRWLRRWLAGGRHLHLLDQRVDTSTSEGWMMFTMLSAAAEFARNRLSERVVDSLAYKKAMRQKYCARVYGWRDDAGLLEPHRGEQREISRMRRMREGGVSLRAVAEALNKRRVPTPKGGSRWHPETVRRILNNDINREAEPAA